jgi:hypothetical protein
MLDMNIVRCLSADLEFKGKLVFRIIKPETKPAGSLKLMPINSNFNKMFHKDVP